VTTSETYLFVGDHAETLASGRPVAPGDTIDAGDLSPDDPHDRALLDDGRLADTTPVRTGYDAQTVDQLQALADTRGLTVEGTGSGGHVVKADLVAALQASDATTDSKEGS
jgi:hypothetical protein